MDVDLQIFSIRNIQKKEHIFQVRRILDDVLEVERICDGRLKRRHLFVKLLDRLRLFDSNLDSKLLLLTVVEGMNYYTPNATSELLVVRVYHNLIRAYLIRLEQVVPAIDLLSVDAYVEVGVRLIIERPRVYLDDSWLLQAEEEVAVIAALAPEIDRLIVL